MYGDGGLPQGLEPVSVLNIFSQLLSLREQTGDRRCSELRKRPKEGPDQSGSSIRHASDRLRKFATAACVIALLTGVVCDMSHCYMTVL